MKLVVVKSNYPIFLVPNYRDLRYVYTITIIPKKNYIYIYIYIIPPSPLPPNCSFLYFSIVAHYIFYYWCINEPPSPKL